MTSTEERISKLERSVEAISETLEIISDKKMLRAIKAGLDDLKKEHYTDYQSVDELKKRFSAQP